MWRIRNYKYDNLVDYNKIDGYSIIICIILKYCKFSSNKVSTLNFKTLNIFYRNSIIASIFYQQLF